MPYRNHLHIGLLALCALLFGPISASAQSDLLASNDEIELVEEQHSAANAENNIIVDPDSETNAYPSMEDEMRMYIQLKKDVPQMYCFPNPSNGVVWLEHNLGDEVTLTIIDNTGKLQHEAENQKAKKVDLSDYEPGSYQLVLSNGEKALERQIVVK